MLKEVLGRFFQSNKAVLGVFCLALFLRLVLLDKFPIGITHDELNYIISAKSLFFTGKFAPQTAPAILPSLGSSTVVVAEIPALILAPFIGLTKFSLLASRIVGAVFSSFSIVVLYELVLILTKKKNYALIAGIIMAINPWSFLMGRTVFEVNFFVFFFLTGLLILLKNKGFGIFWSFPLFLLGFFGYTGGQIAFYLFIIASLVFHYFISGKKNLRIYAVYVLVITLILTAYIARVFTNQSYATRGGEIFLPTNPQISKQVDYERLISVPDRSNSLFINKGTIYFKGVVEKYLHGFSTENLFVNGEFRAAFSYQKHGAFYLMDVFFILLGLGVLFKMNRRVWGFILAVIIFSSITSGLSIVEFSYSQRVGLSYPFLIVLISLGIGYLLEVLKGRRKYILGAVIFLVYLVSFLNLIHLYFLRFPVYASDGWFFQDRQISRYIELTKEISKDQKIVVSTFESKIVFEEYLFYADKYSNKDEVKAINEKLSKNDFSIDNISFTSECLDSKKIPNDTTWIYDPLSGCSSDKNSRLRITRFRDVYEMYLIGNDLVCKNENLGSYVDPSAFKDFNIENQSISDFCKAWITKI